MATEVVKNNLPHIESQIAKAFSELVRKTALAIEAGAKQLAPVDTGFLRNSLTTEINEPLKATVGTNVEYAKYQEFGTRFQKGKAFLTPAFDEEKKGFESAVAQIERSLR
jgi:HK97 gp10 family phage protein